MVNINVGRPKKKRKIGVDEAMLQTSNLSMRYVSVTCAKCGNMGHNSRTCKGQGGVGPSKASRG
ncbi:hypothetical protein LXL04_003573 [Taraxacum kok-saghyz]